MNYANYNYITITLPLIVELAVFYMKGVYFSSTIADEIQPKLKILAWYKKMT